MRSLLDNSDIDYHVIPEIFVSRNEGVALVIFETYAFGTAWAGIKSVKILDSRDY